MQYIFLASSIRSSLHFDVLLYVNTPQFYDSYSAQRHSVTTVALKCYYSISATLRYNAPTNFAWMYPRPLTSLFKPIQAHKRILTALAYFEGTYSGNNILLSVSITGKILQSLQKIEGDIFCILSSIFILKDL